MVFWHAVELPSPIITGHLEASGQAREAEPVGTNKKASQDDRGISLATGRPMRAGSR